jgi:hypothetical protein
MNGGIIQLRDAQSNIITQLSMNGGSTQTFNFIPAYTCENGFQGGGWVLVRRVKQGSTTWHPTTDNLAGTQAAYGVYGNDISDATFGIPYSPWVTANTEFLFATGMILSGV